jgi:hypothetical protein
MHTGTTVFQWTLDRGSSDQMMHGVASSATWIRFLVGLTDISVNVLAIRDGQAGNYSVGVFCL